MQHTDLPERWQNKLKGYLELIGSERDRLSSSDFSVKSVKLSFEDGSYAEFNYALLIDAPELQEVGLFTEHCGYHIFNSNALDLSSTYGWFE